MGSIQEIRNEYDMLTGNMNRMCVTDDRDELIDRMRFAKANIDRLYSMNLDRIRSKKED
ncbi:MAG: hypothetical protein ACK5MN_11795 [Lachnospiraceae bacterium]